MRKMLTWHIYPEYGNPSTIYSAKHDFLGKQVMEPLVSYRKKKKDSLWMEARRPATIMQA